jgi:hypothetical protein
MTSRLHKRLTEAEGIDKASVENVKGLIFVINLYKTNGRLSR